MDYQVEPTRSRPPVLKRVAAGLVLIVAAALAVHFIIGLVLTVFWIVAIAAVVVAVIWALKTI
jgi:4-hydroxybenzoate polyprenyltransferase